MIYSISSYVNEQVHKYNWSCNQYNPSNEPTMQELESDAPAARLANFVKEDYASDNLRGETGGIDGTYYIDWGIVIPKGYYQISFQKYWFTDSIYSMDRDISCVLIQQDTPLPSPVSPLDITNKKAFCQTFPVQWSDDVDYKQCVLDFLNIISSCLVNQNVWLQIIAQKPENVNLEHILSTIGEILHDKEFTQPILINQNNTENFATLENEDWNLNNDEY